MVLIQINLSEKENDKVDALSKKWDLNKQNTLARIVREFSEKDQDAK